MQSDYISFTSYGVGCVPAMDQSHKASKYGGGGGGGRKGKREKGGLGKIGKKEITATRIIAIDFGHESGRKVENVIASLRRACRTLLQISLDYLFDELSHGSLQSHMSFRAKIKNCFFLIQVSIKAR